MYGYGVTRRNRADHNRAWTPSGPTFLSSIVDLDQGGDDYKLEATPALCAIEQDDQEDIWYIKSASLDRDGCIGREGRILGRLGAAFAPTLSHLRRCMFGISGGRPKRLLTGHQSWITMMAT